MSYIENNLSNGEKVVLEGKVHWIKIIPHVIAFFTTKLALTNKKVIGKVGFIKKATLDMPLNRVQGITFAQGLFGKIFNYGTIEISSAADKVTFHYIAKPEAFKKAVLNQMDIFEDEKVQKQATTMAKAMKE